MGILVEGNHEGGFLVSEASKTRSRDTVGFTQAEEHLTGTIVAILTAGADKGKYIKYNVASGDPATGILFTEFTADTVLEAKEINKVVFARDAEANGKELVYPAGLTTTQIETIHSDLAVVGIVVR